MIKQFSFTKEFVENSFEYLMSLGISENMTKFIFVVATIIVLVAVGWLLNFLFDKGGAWISERVTKKLNKDQFLTYILKWKAGSKLTRILVMYLAKMLFTSFYGTVGPIIHVFIVVMDLYMLFYFVSFVTKIIFATRDWAFLKPEMHNKPLDSLAQIANIINLFIGILMTYSIVTGNSVNQLLTVLGAASAVLILVFKDTILGFVGSIQLSSHDMVKVGDWVSIENYDANGTVLEIGVTAVKIQNFDRTITSVPTSVLVSDSFINWKGMQESGGRRIKRSLFIKQSSIRFLREEELDRFKKIHPLDTHIEKITEDKDKSNSEKGVDQSLLINKKNTTNFGLFRKYAQDYIKSLPVINTDMIVMVRQLQPTDKGIPLEIYAFSKAKEWVQYEHVMADIFDHLIASVPFFELEIFELPSGGDYQFYAEETEEAPRAIKKKKKKSNDLPF